MSEKEYEVISSSFKRTSEVPKDEDIFYRCTDCGGVIPSVPDDNIGCSCGNIFIDKDCWRLIVVDITKLEVVKKRSVRKTTERQGAL
jgi:translation initiation factor 2B subunit (eIF-2B alpha/beta/delta family)